MTSCVSRRFSLLVPSRSIRYGIASSRKPSTPISSQNSIVLSTASSTAGLSKFRSGWWLKKRCQKYWPATSSQVQFDFSVSVKMMRVPLYSLGSSLQT